MSDNMEKRSLVLLWILLLCMVIVYIDSKPVPESEPELSNDVSDESSSSSETNLESKHNISSIPDNSYPTSPFEYSTSPATENTISSKSNESPVKSYTPSPNVQETSDHVLSDIFLAENYTSFSTTKYLSSVSNISLNENSLNTQPLTSEISTTSEEFFVTSDLSASNTDSVFNESRFPHIKDSSEISAIFSVIDTLTIPPIVSEKSVFHSNNSSEISEHSLVTASVHSSSLNTEDFSDISTFPLINDTFYDTTRHELPVTMTTDFTDAVSAVNNSDQTDSSVLITQPSSQDTIINSNASELGQQSSTTELVKSTPTDESGFTDAVSLVSNSDQTDFSNLTPQSSSEDIILNSTVSHFEQQSSTTELPVKPTHTDASDFTDASFIVSNSDQIDSSDLTTQFSSQDAIKSTVNELKQQSLTTELPVKSTYTDASEFTDAVSVASNSNQTDSTDLATQSSSDDTITNSTDNELEQQSPTTELPAKSTHTDASDFTDTVSVVTNSDQTDSIDLNTQFSSEDTIINSIVSEFEQQSLTTELPVKSTHTDASYSTDAVSVVSNLDQTDSIDLTTQLSSEDTSINSTVSEFEQQSLTTELPVKSTHTDASDFPDVVPAVSNSDQIDSDDFTTQPSSEATTINSTVGEFEQQPLTTELPAKSTHSQSGVLTIATETPTPVANTTSHSSTEYSETINISSTTKLFEDTTSSQVLDVTDVVSAETTSLGSTPETNDTAEGDLSVCNVCQNCTDGYIDRVISDVTAGLPNSLELPNRQGRFQLYHGQLFGLKTLKRSERALVACIDSYNYLVMVPLRIQNAKAFYKWQVEMPLRTFYGDMNVTIANTECRVFYSHSKDGSLVEGLKITALEGIETEFSGMGPLNGMMAGFTRTWINLFKRSFAKTIENTLVHVINKELQDVKKYKEFYDIKQ